MQVGQVRHTITFHLNQAGPPTLALPEDAQTYDRPAPVLCVHKTAYCYTGDADPSVPGGITAIYRDPAADDQRTRQVTADVAAALARGRNCLVLTNWTAHLQKLADSLRDMGHDPVVLRGGMGAKSRAAALDGCSPSPAARPCSSSLPGPTQGKDSTARRWTRCSSPRRSPTRAAWCSTRADPPVPRRQERRRGPRLPRRDDRRPLRGTGQTRARLHQSRFPRPEALAAHARRQHSRPGMDLVTLASRRSRRT